MKGGDEGAGLNWQQLKRESQDRERWRDFLKDLLYAPHRMKGFKSSKSKCITFVKKFPKKKAAIYQHLKNCICPCQLMLNCT